MRKFILVVGGIVVGLIILVVLWGGVHVRDRHPGYQINLRLPVSKTPGNLRVGFAKVPITPEIRDTWTDVNRDARYTPADGDTYQDANGNGHFDAYWMAGFQNRRAAKGIHDNLWARAMVLDDGTTRLGLVALDVIGFGHDYVVTVRQNVMRKSDLDYLVICTTHNHEGPDLIGLWGDSYLKSGVNGDYLKYVQKQIGEAVRLADAHQRPSVLRFAQDLTGAKSLVMDSRRPSVLDPGLRLMQAIDAETDTTLGVLVAWANHPETLWSRNLLITSDFPNYLRKGMEQGVKTGQDSVPGVGGVAIYVNGAIGGLMTTDPEFSVSDPALDTAYTKPSFEKARAQGEQLALLALQALRKGSTDEVRTGSISLRAKTIILPIKNTNFRLAAFLGVLDRGFVRWAKIRSEVAVWTIGPASFSTIPGEIYPEIINGGIESPPGQDYQTGPIEIPPVRELMPGKYRFVLGLANDEVGYIIPRSEWDEKAPYLYEQDHSPYGEGMSLGPRTALLIHAALQNLWEKL